VVAVQWQTSALWAALFGVGVGWVVLAVVVMWSQAHRQRAATWGYPTDTGVTLGAGVWVSVAAGTVAAALGVLALTSHTPRLAGVVAPLAVLAVAASWIVRTRAAQIVGELSRLGPPTEPVIAPARSRKLRDLHQDF